jgi:MFS family permease
LDNEKRDDEKKEKKIGFSIFFSNWKVLTKMLVMMCQWFCVDLVYYGISLNTDVLGGDPYLNFLYFTIVEFFSMVACQFILERYGRKLPYLINFFMIAFSLTIIGFVPVSTKWLIIILVLISKFSISFNFNAIYVITGESYPTIIRNTAMSSCSMVARIASTISPLIAVLGETYWKPLPYLIYGAVAALSGILFFCFIPETRDLNLPESLDDICESES